MEEKSRYLSLDEVGRCVGLSPITLRRYVADGRLPAARLGGRVRVAEADLENFIEARAVVPSSPARSAE
jgi:excisionase family DNA binding protein